MIAGLRPEHFEDAALVPDRSAGRHVQRQDRRARVDGLGVLRVFRRRVRARVLDRARGAGPGRRRRRAAARRRRPAHGPRSAPRARSRRARTRSFGSTRATCSCSTARPATACWRRHGNGASAPQPAAAAAPPGASAESEAETVAGGDAGEQSRARVQAPANLTHICRRRAPPAWPASTRRPTSCALAGQATFSRLVSRLRGLPDDVGVILPFEEVDRGARIRQRAQRRARGGPARPDRRQRRPRARLRSQLPPHLGPHAQSLGADRDRDAPRRVDAADRPRPRRRDLLRSRRPPPRLGLAGAGARPTSTPT